MSSNIKDGGETMYCPKCGAENPDDAKFCSECGSQLKSGITTAPEPEKELTNYAGFWRRFAAYLIDSIILSIGGFIIGGIFGIMLWFSLGDMETDISTAITEGFSSILGIVINWLYFTLLESSHKQATLGKMAVGIIVTDLDGNRISFGRANGRYWGKIISSITLLIGFIMAGFTEKKQALHDIIAGTLVIRK